MHLQLIEDLFVLVFQFGAVILELEVLFLRNSTLAAICLHLSHLLLQRFETIITKIGTCQATLDTSVPKRFHCPEWVSAVSTAHSPQQQQTVPAPSLQSCIISLLLLVELLVVLLKDMPFLLRVHLLHLLVEGDMIIPQDLKSLIEPLKSFEHGHASLFPEHAGYLSLVGPHGILLLLMVGIVIGLFIVALGHGPSLLVHLGVGVKGFLLVEGRRLHECSIVLILVTGLIASLSIRLLVALRRKMSRVRVCLILLLRLVDVSSSWLGRKHLQTLLYYK